MLRTGVAVEKLSSRKTAEIRSRQEALRTISPPRLDIFYHPNFGFLRKKRVFQQPQELSTLTGIIWDSKSKIAYVWRQLSRSSGVLLAACVFVSADVCRAQDLTPRAYVITPIHTNAVILTYSFKSGSIVFDPTLPTQTPRGSSAFRYSAPITRSISSDARPISRPLEIAGSAAHRSRPPSGALANPVRTDAAIAVCIFPRFGGGHGMGSFEDSCDWNSRAGVWRLSRI